jgi:hypothetical protein
LGAGLPLPASFSLPAAPAAAAGGLLLLLKPCCSCGCSAVKERLAVQGDGDGRGALQGAKGCLLGLHSALLGDSALASDLTGDMTLLCSDIVPDTAAAAAFTGLLLVARPLAWKDACSAAQLLLPSVCKGWRQLLPSLSGNNKSALADGPAVSKCQAVGGDSSRLLVMHRLVWCTVSYDSKLLQLAPRTLYLPRIASS